MSVLICLWLLSQQKTAPSRPQRSPIPTANSGLALRLSSGSDLRRPQRAPAELPVPLSTLCHPHPQSPHHTALPSESRHIGNSHKVHESPDRGVQACPTRKVKVLVTQSDSFLTPMDCSPPGFSVCGILQARILEGLVIPFSRGSS